VNDSSKKVSLLTTNVNVMINIFRICHVKYLFQTDLYACVQIFIKTNQIILYTLNKINN